MAMRATTPSARHSSFLDSLIKANSDGQFVVNRFPLLRTDRGHVLSVSNAVVRLLLNSRAVVRQTIPLFEPQGSLVFLNEAGLHLRAWCCFEFLVCALAASTLLVVLSRLVDALACPASTLLVVLSGVVVLGLGSVACPASTLLVVLLGV
jgi:hypothetical protein